MWENLNKLEDQETVETIKKRLELRKSYAGQLILHPDLGPLAIATINTTSSGELHKTEPVLHTLTNDVEMSQIVKKELLSIDQIGLLPDQNRFIVGPDAFQTLTERKLAINSEELQAMLARDNPEEITVKATKAIKRIWELSDQEVILDERNKLTYDILEPINKTAPKTAVAIWDVIPTKIRRNLELQTVAIEQWNGEKKLHITWQEIHECQFRTLWGKCEINYIIPSTQNETPPIGHLAIITSRDPINGKPTLSREQLEITDKFGYTGWHYAAATGRLQEAEALGYSKAQIAKKLTKRSTEKTPLAGALHNNQLQDIITRVDSETILNNPELLETLIENEGIGLFINQLEPRHILKPGQKDETIAITLLKSGWATRTRPELWTDEILKSPINTTTKPPQKIWMGAWIATFSETNAPPIEKNRLLRKSDAIPWEELKLPRNWAIKIINNIPENTKLESPTELQGARWIAQNAAKQTPVKAAQWLTGILINNRTASKLK